MTRKPELRQRWIGLHGHSLVECEVDRRVGGGFRFVLEGPGGRWMGMRGEYKELSLGRRCIWSRSTTSRPGGAGEEFRWKQFKAFGHYSSLRRQASSSSIMVA